MGTNYYLQQGVTKNRLHIGKSSVGWCFKLHVYPENPELPQNLGDWRGLFVKPGNKILDQYGEFLTVEAMLSRIEDRSGNSPSIPLGYPSWTAYYRSNYALPGPNGLIRSSVDGYHCVGHGAGTWDLIAGEFS